MQNLLILPVAAATCVATMIGGWVGISLRDRLHLVLAFSAGAVIGVAFFDLMPEALATGANWGSRNILLLCALGFFVYTIIDRAVLLHEHGDEHQSSEARGWIGAGSFSDRKSVV